MKKILIIQTAFLGDVILATPVISELKRIYPDSTIDVLVKKGNQSLLENNPKTGTVYTFNKADGKWKDIFRLIKLFRKNRYDLIINLHRFSSSGIIAGFSGGKKVYGFRKNPFSFLYSKKFDHVIGDGTHEVERNLSIIQEFGAEKLVRPELFPSDDDFEKVTPFTQSPFVTMAPSSVWFTKQLPKEKWLELIMKTPKEKQIFLLGGPADKDLCEEIIKNAHTENISSLAGELSLLQSAALMSKAVMNYVNDSGPLHLASSMNANVTAYFCSTVPSFGFGPLSDNSTIKEVLNLPCRPCGLHGHKACPEGHFKCGKNMEV